MLHISRTVTCKAYGIFTTVLFISFATFHEDVTQKVIKIIEFWKKFLKDSVNAFYDMWLPGFFHKNLVLGTNTELDVIISKLFLCKNLSFGLFPFKLLSFLNKLSYRFQIGLKWKLFWSSFWECLRYNVQLMFWIDLWAVTQLLIQIFIKRPFFSSPMWYTIKGKFPSLHFLKLLKISFNLRPIWYQ